MATRDVETSTTPVLLKESDIPEVSIAVRKPLWSWKNLIFCSSFRHGSLNVDSQILRRRRGMLISNDPDTLATITLLAMSFRQRAVAIYQIKLNNF